MLWRAFILTAPLLYVGCGKSPMAPLTPTLKVSAISPPTGSTTGGTAVTVTGAEFTSDAVLIVGGVAATKIVVQGSSTITAVLGPHPAAGAGDVVVFSGGKSVSLANGFTFFAPTGTNQPPVVLSIRSVGSRTNQPSGFADLDESVTLIPTISNAESSVRSSGESALNPVTAPIEPAEIPCDTKCAAYSGRQMQARTRPPNIRTWSYRCDTGGCGSTRPRSRSG